MATTADAEIILKLYDFRREETMRKARNIIGMEWWPLTADEFKEIHKPTNPNNAYWRQVVSFWEGMAELPLHGAVDTDLYLATQGEALFIRAKFAALSEEATGKPFMPKTLQLMEGSEKAKAMYAGMLTMMSARRAQLSAKPTT